MFLRFKYCKARKLPRMYFTPEGGIARRLTAAEWQQKYEAAMKELREAGK